MARAPLTPLKGPRRGAGLIGKGRNKGSGPKAPLMFKSVVTPLYLYKDPFKEGRDEGSVVGSLAQGVSR